MMIYAISICYSSITESRTRSHTPTSIDFGSSVSSCSRGCSSLDLEYRAGHRKSEASQVRTIDHICLKPQTSYSQSFRATLTVHPKSLYFTAALQNSPPSPAPSHRSPKSPFHQPPALRPLTTSPLPSAPLTSLPPLYSQPSTPPGNWPPF